MRASSMLIIGPFDDGSNAKTIALMDQSENANIGRRVQPSDNAFSTDHTETNDFSS